MFLVNISIMFFILTCYVGWRVIQYLPLRRVWRWLILALYFIFSQNFLIYILLRNMGLAHYIPETAFFVFGVAQGACIFVALLSIAREIALLVWFSAGRIFFARPLRNASASRAAWLKGMRVFSVAICILAILLAGFAAYNAMRLPDVRKVSLAEENLPPALEGFNIAVLSDLHIGTGFEGEWLEHVVQKTNALQADLIVIVGDMLDGDAAQMRADLAPLEGLRARYGVFVVTGNHEYYGNFENWLAHMRASSALCLLLNNGQILDVNGAKLGLGGAGDEVAEALGLGGEPNLAAAYAPIASADYKILLWHRPRQAARAAAEGFDLQVSGHTHGGQFFPGNIFVRVANGYSSGLYQVENMQLYVSPGSGLWGRIPLRLGTAPEITLLKLTARKTTRN